MYSLRPVIFARIRFKNFPKILVEIAGRRDGLTQSLMGSRPFQHFLATRSLLPFIDLLLKNRKRTLSLIRCLRLPMVPVAAATVSTHLQG
jgi:hypothetical protein